MKARIAILYSPEGGNVEKVAHTINRLAPFESEIFALSQFTLDKIEQFDFFIIGCSTVGAIKWKEASQTNEWDLFFHSVNMENISLKNKTFAIYGLGNHVSHPNHFADNIMDVYTELNNSDAEIIGKTSLKGYDFISSRAIINGQFIGLPIDELNEPQHTNQRIESWLKSLTPFFL